MKDRTSRPAATAGRLFLGTSGFGYDAWKGAFYPKDIKAKDMLAYYASRFSSVEINYTFRSLLTAKAAATWTAATPETFVFALKAHMRVTNSLKLDDARKAAALLFDAIAPLGPRTGPVLVQLSKRVETEAGALEAYLDVLRPGFRCALELTHAKWDDVRPLAEPLGFGRCVADTDEEPAPDDVLASGPFAYVRLRRTNYTARDLAKWAARIREALAAGRDVYAYFRHEETGTGPRFAEALAAAMVR